MMDVIQQEFLVPVRYPVHFTTGVFIASNRLLRDLVAGEPRGAAITTSGEDALPAKLVVVLDRGVERAHPTLVDAIDTYCKEHHDALALAAPVLVVPGGEPIKNERRHADRIVETINAAELCRHSYVVAIGGGAVLDAAGFAAATAHRGVRLIRVPTTVLSQDDSAMGVKNGVNAFGKKNYLGTFAPPFAVINDFEFPARRCRIATGAAGSPRRSRPRSSATRLSSISRAARRRACRRATWPPMEQVDPAVGGAASRAHRDAAATRSSSAPPGRSTSGTGPRTSSSS